MGASVDCSTPMRVTGRGCGLLVSPPVFAAILRGEIGEIAPVTLATPAQLVGRVDPASPRVRYHRASWRDHQDGMWRPSPAADASNGEQLGRVSCQWWVESIFIDPS